ncbi:MAG: beta strand repeat-containing protein [Terriglobales bacterium]
MVLGAGGGDTATVQTTGNVTLNQTGGGVSQGSGSLLTNGLRLLGAGAFSLNQAGNNVSVLVANLTGATTTLSYRDANGFSIGTGGGGLSTAKTAGAAADTTYGITVGTAGTAANTLTLNAYGAVTQASSLDNVIAGGLQLLGNGPYTLTNAGNDVTTFAANVAGNVSYRDANGFTVGIVADAPSAVSTAGITTTSGGSLTLDNAGTLTIAQNVSTDGAFAQISNAGTGSVSITSPRTISTTSDAVSIASPVTLNGAGTTTTIDTRVDGGTGGDITFQSTLNATTAATNAEALTLNAGTGGNILFTGAVGGVTRLGAINLTNANNVTTSAGLTAASVTQTAGQGTTTFNGAVNTNTGTGVNLTGNAQTVNSTITTTGGGTLTFTNAGLLTLNGDIASDGAVTQNGAGAVTIDTDRTITTTGDAVGFATGVTLAKTGGTGLFTINSTSGNAAGANITFSSTLDGSTAGAEPLTLNAGTGGNILFTGAVGGGTRLGAINLTNANNVTESSGITAASLTQTAGQGTTTLNGAVNTNTGTGVNLTGTNQTVNNTITTTGGGTVTFSNAGLLTLNGDITSDGAVTQNGAGVVTIDTDRTITTTGDAVGFATGVTLAKTGGTGLLTINTTSGNAAGNNITFSSTLDGSTSGAEPMTLNAGTGGNILFTGAVGGGTRLGAINITNANNVTESAGMTAASLTQTAGQGTTTFNGAVNTNTATGVNLTGTTQTVNNTITTTGGGTVTFSNAGLLTLNGDIASDGAVTQNGAGAVTIDTGRTITTTGDAVGFATGVTLAKTGGTGLLTINTTSGNAAGANITFSSTLDGSTAGAEPLTLNAGTGGNILFTGAVGSGTRLGAINLSNANNVTASAGITAASLTQAAGQGTTTFNGAVNTNTATGVSLTGNNQTVNSTITTTGGGTVTFTNAGLLTLNGDIASDGAVTQNGAGAVTIDTNRTITTTGDAVGFATGVTLAKTGGTGLLTINTTSGNAAGANVTFNNILTGTTDSAENVTINAGSGGGVTFNGAVGATRLGDVNITQARDLTIQSGFNSKTLTQSQGATGAPSATASVGTTTINGAVDTTGNTSLATSGALNLTGAGSITAGTGSTVNLTSGSDMTLSGNVTAPAGATLDVTGTDRILSQNGGTLATTDSAIALIADEMMLTGAIDSGSGAVTLKPNNPADAIQLGVASAATNNAVATLELADSELNTISTTGGLTIGAANNSGSITVVGALTPTTAQNGLTLLNNTGGIAINAPITYAAGNGNLTLAANGGGAAAGAISTSGSALDVAGTLALNAATGVGTLASPMVLSHAAGTTLTITNTTGNGVFVRADLGDLNISSISNSAATGGGIDLNVGTNLNINGTVQNTAGNIQFVAGNDAAYTAAGGFGLSPASVAVGTLGGVNIDAQVIAGNGGAISIFATGAVQQSATAAAGLQSVSAKGSVAQGALSVRTFNNGNQVGTINLQNNLAGSGNSMGPITLEARLAGSTNPPPYAQSNIDYKSINGTSISGIGTAADFSLVAPSQIIDLAPGASLSGTNISLIATAGDVTVKSAITNAQVNGGQSGGSLNLYASGNIVLDNPGGSSAGVVIGKDLGTLDALGNRQYEKFDHTLTLVATGDIKIYGTVEVTGDLALRANASASEASGPRGVPGFGAGSGSVLIAGSAGNPVEVRANNIIVGTKDASGNPLPVQNLTIDDSANSAGGGQFFDTVLRANKALDVYLNGDQGGPGTSGNIVITGGSAAATSSGVAGVATKSSAVGAMRGSTITILGVKGGTQVTLNPDTQTVNPLLPYTTNSSSITLNGGTATSNTAAGGGQLSAADALILATTSKFVDIGGNLILTVGTGFSEKGGKTSA